MRGYKFYDVLLPEDTVRRPQSPRAPANPDTAWLRPDAAQPRRPLMKECQPLITHWSDDCMMSGSLSKQRAQTSGAMVE